MKENSKLTISVCRHFENSFEKEEESQLIFVLPVLPQLFSIYRATFLTMTFSFSASIPSIFDLIFLSFFEFLLNLFVFGIFPENSEFSILRFGFCNVLI